MHPAQIPLQKALARLRSATVDELKNVDFLTDLIRSAGLVDDRRELYGEDDKYMIEGGSIYMKPTELALLLVHLSDLKIHSYAEIGVYHGGTFGIIMTYLNRFNSPVFGHAIDICDYLFRESLVGLNYHFTIMDSFHIQRAEGYDLVLIDGGKSYENFKSDFERVGSLAKYCMFHDIVDKFTLDAGVRYWWEIKDNYPRKEFVTAPFDSMGIGFLEIRPD